MLGKPKKNKLYYVNITSYHMSKEICKNSSSLWTRFWLWYDRHVTESLVLTAFIIYIQIPHMFWNADLYLQTGVISRINPVADFFFYGVDLIEVFPMINIGFLIYSRVRKRGSKISKQI